MSSIIKEMTAINRAVLVFSCVLFFPVLPVGILLAVLWGWLLNSIATKREFLISNIGFMLLIAGAFWLCRSVYIVYFQIIWKLYSNGWDNNDFLPLFTRWYVPIKNIKYMLLDLGLIFPAVLQAITINNVFLLRSPELSFKGIKRKDKLNYKKVEKTANKIDSYTLKDGSLIGIEVSGNIIAGITDNELNGHLLVAGTTGSGKTVTLKNFILSAIQRSIPLVYVDGKADQKLPYEIEKMCIKYGREFKLFEMTGNSKVKYNPLSTGGFTELKDKIITMKTSDSSGSQFYQTAEGEYLQFLFKVLQKAGKHIDLYSLGSFITMPKLFGLIGTLGDTELQQEAIEIKERLGDKLSGLMSDINTFIKSEIGYLFECKAGDTIIDLAKDIKSGAVIYFSLNDLNYPDYANRLGKLIINDLKSVFGRISENEPVKTFGIFDEFTTYAGEQFTTILSRTRSKGMHAVVGTQSYDTITKISPKLASDLVANCNNFIIHRQNSDVDAEKLSDIIGKTTNYDVTFSNSATTSDGNGGNTQISGRSYTEVRENKVDPEEIQELKDGYAYVLKKKLGSKVALVKIRFLKDY